MSWVIENNSGNFEILSQLTEKQKHSLLIDCNKLDSLLKEFNFVEEVNDTYKEYLECLGDKDISTKKLVRYINNYLSSYKGFIDRWETYLKRNKDESFIQFFKEALSAIYEKYFEYRFLYNLRNYAQHSGTPVSKVSNSITDGIRVTLEKGKFIDNHTGMQPKFKKELDTISLDELDVDNTIKVVHKQLLELHNVLCNRELNSLNDEYLIASVNVLNFYREYSKNQGELALTDLDIEEIRKMSLEPGQITLNLSKIPRLLAKTIISGAYIKFKFKGRNIGPSNGFPIVHIPKTALEISKFQTGREYVKSRGITWIRVVESTGLKYRDGYDRYFSVYFPQGLTMKEYEEKAEMFNGEMEKLFK